MWEIFLLGAIVGLIFGILNRINSYMEKKDALRDQPIKIKPKDTKLDKKIAMFQNKIQSRNMHFNNDYIPPDKLTQNIIDHV